MTDNPRNSLLFRNVLRPTIMVASCLVLLTLSVCSGCNSKPSPQQKSEADQAQSKLDEEKKKKKRLEIEPLRPLVDQEPPSLEETALAELTAEGMDSALVVKPGHWIATVQTMKANYDDFVGRSTAGLLDQRRETPPLAATRYRFRNSRQVALAKGREKRVAGELFFPEQSPARRVEVKLEDHGTGREWVSPALPIKRMPPYQYTMVVLAKEVSRYGFLKVADAVRMPWEEEFEEASEFHYRVVLADAADAPPLPDNMLTWSSIAYVVWDEVDPESLSAQQQAALVDWLHWGGRLIINGPDSLDALRGSFLDPWLPADRGGSREFARDDLRQWSQYWSERQRAERVEPLAPTQPWSGIQLLPRDDARELAGGGGLFVERSVGLGSVVVSAIQLAERDLINWPGYDSFLNAGILRRPRRRFAEGAYGGLRIDWADHRGRRLDAHLTTGLRLFARDAGTKANLVRVESTETDQVGPQNDLVDYRVDRQGGLGAWSAFSPVSNAAREALTEAAAVRLPGAGFVVAALALYLVVLVPLNWMVFRAVDRVEWAWIAAPVIAVLGTWAIVHQARLDIGFVRSQTEIALLELHGRHDRGLLSRFTALYSSLSTTYDVTFDNGTAVATPFPATPFSAKGDETIRVGDRIWDVVFEKQRETHLDGLTISSASTRMVQSEEMFSLAGAIQVGESSRGQEQLENRSGYRLRDVAVVERTVDQDGRPQYRGDWIGDLRDGDSAVLLLAPVDLTPERAPFADQRRQSALEAVSSRLHVDRLFNLAFQFPTHDDPLYAERGELRMIAVIDELFPGTEVSPVASQIQGATVVVAHLRYNAPAAARPDVNSRTDVLNDKSQTSGTIGGRE